MIDQFMSRSLLVCRRSYERKWLKSQKDYMYSVNILHGSDNAVAKCLCNRKPNNNGSPSSIRGTFRYRNSFLFA